MQGVLLINYFNMYFLLKQCKKEIHLLCNKNDRLPYDFDL